MKLPEHMEAAGDEVMKFLEEKLKAMVGEEHRFILVVEYPEPKTRASRFLTLFNDTPKNSYSLVIGAAEILGREMAKELPPASTFKM